MTATTSMQELWSPKMKCSLRGTEVKKIRESTGLTQAAFSEQYKIPVGALTMWEQDRRDPHEATATYLRLIQLDPEGIAQMVRKLDHSEKRLVLAEEGAAA